MISYKILSTEKHIILTNEVLEHFSRYRQIGMNSKETGGQLFAKLEEKRIIVEKATGPRTIDKRGRFHFIPTRKAEQREINNMFSYGLHYVGDWHTHPEKRPSPSRTDISSMSECFQKSKHELDAFILIIVGQDNPPGGIWLSLHEARRYETLSPSPATQK